MSPSLPEIDPESGDDFQRQAASYLRISKADGQQTEENQRRELKDFLERQGYELVGENVDHESETTGRRESNSSFP